MDRSLLQPTSTGETDQGIEGTETEESRASQVCGIVPNKIDSILHLPQITPQIIAGKLALLKTIDNKTFFGGKPGNTIENGGIHIWYMNNYRSLLQAKERGSSNASKIIHILTDFVREDLKESGIQIPDGKMLSLSPQRMDMGQMSEKLTGTYCYSFLLGINDSIFINKQRETDKPFERMKLNNPVFYPRKKHLKPIR